jgi:hypothetical protein
MFSEDNNPDLRSNLDYSIEHRHHQKRILEFLQDNLPTVARRLVGTTLNLTALKEDDVTREIAHLLNDGLRITGGYLFGFEAKSGPDILIYALPYELFAPALFVIEAKRLPPTRSRDYVHSGIGRFKKEEHGERHEVAAMLAYVQDKDFTHWHKTINSWIDDLIHNADESPAWTAQDKLRRVKEDYIGEYNSIHSRVSRDSIALRHFWIMLNKTKAN